jgi:hypothetical protein
LERAPHVNKVDLPKAASALRSVARTPKPGLQNKKSRASFEARLF